MTKAKRTFFLEQYAFFYDLFYSDKNYAQECQDVEKIIKKYSLIKRPKKILDLACGTGTHDLLFAKAGYEVQGVDLSAQMIEIAEKKAKGKARLSFTVKNMLEIDYQEEFEVVLCMFAALPYITERHDLLTLFQKVRSALKPGGVFIFDLWNGIIVPNSFAPQRVKEIKKGDKTVLRISNISLDTVNQLATNTFETFSFDKNVVVDRFKETHTTRFYTVTEIRDTLLEAGFSKWDVFPFGQLGKPLNQNHWDVQFVATK